MEASATYEYVVRQKGKGVTVKKILFTLFYVIFTASVFTVGVISKFFPCLALVPLVLWIVVFFTWRYTDIEFEYSMTSGEVTLSNIYGGRSRKAVEVFRIKDCELIAPLSANGDQLTRFNAEKTFSLLSKKDADGAYFAIYKKGEKRYAVLFEATERALKICKFYNSNATVTSSVAK